jgi:RHS repeat-associated protein
LFEETYPSGRVVKNTLDIDGDLAQVQSKKLNGTLQNYANAFTYTSAGAVSSMRLGNGKFENTTFNSRLQPIQIGLGSSATSQNLLKLNFDYGVADNNGNVKSQTITTPTVGNVAGFTATQNYTYDSLNRLKSAVETIPNQTGWKQTFKYDRYGNREFDTQNNNTNTLANGCPVAVCNPQASPTNNKLVGTTYDDAGNTKIDASNQSYVYDAENKMVKAKNASGATLGDYFYDGDGKRIKKMVPNGETTIFVYDASGKMVAEYSTVTASQEQAKISYLTNDHLGSPRITTDATGKVVSRRDFMPFGEEIQRADYGNDSIREKFATYERDYETSLDFAQARMFGSSFGRFTSVDPYNIVFEKERGRNKREKNYIFNNFIMQPQNWNGYAYVVNNPSNLSDPSGLTYLTDGNGNYVYIADKDYAKVKNDKNFYPGYSVIPDGTVVNVNIGTGFLAGFDGQDVTLGANFQLTGVMRPKIDDSFAETVYASQDPIELPPADLQPLSTDGKPTFTPNTIWSELVETRQFSNGTFCGYRSCGPLTNDIIPSNQCFVDSSSWWDDISFGQRAPGGVCPVGYMVTNQRVPFFIFGSRCVQVFAQTLPFNPCSTLK